MDSLSWLLGIACVYFVAIEVTAHEADRFMEDPNMFQGDIELRGSDRFALTYAKAGFSNAYAMVRNRKWPNPRSIPYEIDRSIASDRAAQTSIREAIADFERLTCLRFRRRSWSDKEYLKFTDGNGCFSPVGWAKNQFNRVQLWKGCRVKGVVMHEMLHSLGFWHEQNRSDRDHYVYIDYSNIDRKWHYAFDKQNDIDSKGSPYDFDSVMHYSSKAFALDYKKNTITTRDSRNQKRIGQRKGLSVQDIYQVKLRYCY